MGTNHKIHIGFNFHVNFFHVDKGDTNDGAGFERDLKMVRFILESLLKVNNDGQPVKATWDFETDYTLVRILPSLGPDVIDDVKARLRERGDELVISGRHGDMFAAMTQNELKYAIKNLVNAEDDEAVNGKIAKHPLGMTSNVLRPEGYIFSPEIIGDLKKCGIKAVLLGNSAIGPDALSEVSGKTLSDPYSRFNPIKYRNENDSIIVIPVYTPADFMDEGTLTGFLERLHEKQVQGEIDSDLFIMFGADVRSPWWESMNIKSFFKSTVGTEGLVGFFKELRKLDYVAYNTPSGYLADHECVSELSFAGDLAGGMAGGLSPWSEKPSERLIWTRLERAREGSLVYSREKESVSLQGRVKLISASALGPCSIAPSKERFAVLDKLSKEAEAAERNAINEKEMSMRTSGRQRLNNSAIGKHLYSRRKDEEERNSFIIMNTEGQKLVSYQLSIEKGSCPQIGTLVLECDECKVESYTAIPVWEQDGFVTSAFVVMRFADAQDTYKIYYHFDRKDLPKEEHKPLIEVKPEDIPVFHAEGAMKRLLEAQGKLPKEEEEEEGNPAVNERIAAMSKQTVAVRSAALQEPGEKDTYIIESPSRKLKIVVTGTGSSKGKIREVFFEKEKIGDEQFLSSYIKADGKINDFTCDKIESAQFKGQGEGIKITGAVHAKGESSPGSYVMQIISCPALKGIDAVMIYTDIHYPQVQEGILKEVAPLQLSPLYRAGVAVTKISYNGKISEYPVSCFTKTNHENKEIGSFNNHFTAGVIGVKGQLSGILIGQANFFLGGLATCPGRLSVDEDGQHVSLNPYGTYGICKRHYPSKSDGIIQKYKEEVVDDPELNLADSYSGVHEKFCVCLSGFQGASATGPALLEMCAFSRGSVICGDDAGVIHPYMEDNVILPKTQYEIGHTYDKENDPASLKSIRSEVHKHFLKAGK
ncbi:MAG: hypothetical protein E7301_06645 [Butyrivibrio sp.]|nr:hypothetical protein [Butyrivibrio sp.]